MIVHISVISILPATCRHTIQKYRCPRCERNYTSLDIASFPIRQFGFQCGECSEEGYDVPLHESFHSKDGAMIDVKEKDQRVVEAKEMLVTSASTCHVTCHVTCYVTCCIKCYVTCYDLCCVTNYAMSRVLLHVVSHTTQAKKMVATTRSQTLLYNQCTASAAVVSRFVICADHMHGHLWCLSSADCCVLSLSVVCIGPARLSCSSHANLKDSFNNIRKPSCTAREECAHCRAKGHLECVAARQCFALLHCMLMIATVVLMINDFINFPVIIVSAAVGPSGWTVILNTGKGTCCKMLMSVNVQSGMMHCCISV